jgi:hypothetical protein
MTILTDLRNRIRLDLKDAEPTTPFTKSIDVCDNGWWQGNFDHIVVEHDTVEFKEGIASMRALCDGYTPAGLIAYKNISSLDLTPYAEVILWIRCNHTYNAGEIRLLLDNTEGCESPVKILELPAQTATLSWSRISLNLGDTSGLGNIISVGLDSTIAPENYTFWLDAIVAKKQDYRWTDDDLDRHIEHALSDYSLSSPLEKELEIATTENSPEIDLSSIADLVFPFAIEFPINADYPIEYKSYQRFAYFAQKLRFLEIIGDGSNAELYYGASHEIDESSSTVPAHHEDIILTGASAYALLEYAAYSINQDNIDGKAPQYYLAEGNHLLEQFKKKLRVISRKSRVRTRRLYPSDIAQRGDKF